MKIDFSQIIKTIGGETVKIKEGDTDPASLGKVCIYALGAVIPQPGRQTDLDENYKRYRLAMKLERGGEIDCQAVDVTLIKRCAGECLIPFVYGAVCDLIDPPAD